MQALRVALYKRVSSAGQARDGYSLEFQEEILRAYCAREHLELADVYEDGGRSGANTDREGLQRLIADAKRHVFDVVLIFKVDRFSREPLDLLLLLQELRRLGVQLRSVSEAMDFNDPAGELMLTILGAIGKFVRQNIIDNAMKGKRTRAGKGKYTGGGVPFGYVVDEAGVYVADERVIWRDRRAADLVSLIFERFIVLAEADGRGVRALADWLHKEGVPAPRTQWNATSLRQILRNPVYTGDFAWSKTTQPEHGTVRRLPEDRWVLVENNHVPLVDRATFERVQAILVRNAKEARPKRSEPDLLLAGFLTCMNCGSALTARRTAYRGQPRIHYTCNSRFNYNRRRDGLVCAFPYIRAEALDALVWGFMVSVASDPAVVEQLIREARRGEAPLVEALARRRDADERALASVEAKLRRLVDSYADGVLPVDLVREKTAELEERRLALRGALSHVADEMRALSTRTPQLAVEPEDLFRHLQAAVGGAELDLQAKRGVLASIVGPRGIAVAPDGTVQVNMRVPREALRTDVDNLVVETGAALRRSWPP